MCLLVNTEYKIAKEDIICYKVLYKSHYDQSLHSPYFAFKWELNKLTKAKGKPYIRTIEGQKKKKIMKGYFHTFKTIKSAKNLKRRLYYGQFIYKCIIPKGTKYWEGTFNDCKGFASKNLIIKEEI